MTKIKIAEIPKKIYKLQIEAISLSEEIANIKISKKNHSDSIMIKIVQELENGKKKYKNQNERETEFALRALKDKEFLALDTKLRLKEVNLKKKKYLSIYYFNLLKMLPFKDIEVEDIK